MEALRLLLLQGRRMQLLMVNSECPAEASQQIVAEARVFIELNGLADNIRLITDFLPEEEMFRLRQAHLIVFPYTTGDGTSGAVRMGLDSGAAVAVSPHEIFQDVREITFQLPGTSPDSIALGISRVIDGGTDLLRSKKEAVVKWCAERRFPLLAKRLFELIDADSSRYEGSPDFSVRRERRVISSGCESRPATVAPAGST